MVMFEEARRICTEYLDKYSEYWHQAEKARMEAKTYTDTFIFDENLTVKQNRLMAEEEKDRCLKEKKAAETEMKKLLATVEQAIIGYVQGEYNLNDKQAKLIFDRAYDIGHSEGYEEVLSYADDYGDFAKKLLNMKEGDS